MPLSISVAGEVQGQSSASLVVRFRAVAALEPEAALGNGVPWPACCLFMESCTVDYTGYGYGIAMRPRFVRSSKW